jgi:hypothetical protein
MYANSKIHLVNSRNKISGSHSNFMYQFPEYMDKYDKVCLLSASIPKSYYCVQTGLNDTFTLTEGVTNYTVTITAGNYTAKTFASHLTTILNIAHSNTYTCIYPTTSYDQGKLTFTSTGAASFSFASSNSAYELMGFEAGQTYTFVGGSLTSSNVINLNKESTIRVLSNISNDSCLANIIASNTSDFNVIQYNCPDISALSKNISQNNSNTYFFSIVNENNQLLDLNGLNVVLEVLFYQDQSKILIESAKMLKGWIKYQLITEEK